MRSVLRWLTAIFVTAVVFAVSPAAAGNGNTGWSATIYAGPSTNDRFSDSIEGKFRVRGATLGLAVDRRLFNLGWGVSFDADLQVTHNFGKTDYSTVAFGLGVRFHNVIWRGASLAIYSGPSYALSSPILYNRYGRRPHHMRKFLNYIAIEYAVPVPYHARHWDMVMRIYHRSGAWGVYSDDVDEGSVVGLGLRAKF